LPQENKGSENKGSNLDEMCFDLTTQLPDGPDSTLADTGGDYEDGKMWDFQTCTEIIFLCGFSDTSLFPPHKATVKHLAKRCQERFGVTPRPTEMVDTWDYVNKLKTTSHILFVNG
jgi:AraC-like DNA-binding protein